MFFNISSILLLLLIGSPAESKPSGMISSTIQNRNENNKVSECIREIAKRHIPCKSVVFIVSSTTDFDLLLEDIDEYYCFSVVTRSFRNRSWLVYADAYFIKVDNVTDFLIGIRELSTDLSWNPSAKFVILFKDNVEILDGIFKELLKVMILNAAVLIWRNNELEIFTYYPYSGTHCGRSSSDMRSLGYCPSSKNIFQNKVPNGLQNCTMIVAAREDIPNIIFNNTDFSKYLDIGTEQYVLNIIAEYEGIILKYLPVTLDEDYGIILANRTATGLIGYLQKNEADIIAGGLFLMGNRLEVFDYIFGYSYATYSVITPVLEEKRWLRVYQQFGLLTWILIILSFFFTILIILMIQAMTSGRSKDEFSTIIKVWRYLYNQADAGLFMNKYVSRFLIVWVIFANTINAFYSTASYSLITGHVVEKIKVNHSDLATLPFKPCISEVSRTFHLYAYNEDFPQNEYDYLCRDPEDAMNTIATRTDLYNVDTDYAYYLRAPKYLDNEGRVKIIKYDYPRTVILSMYVNKGFPLRTRFERYAAHIYEAGLLEKHLSYILSRSSNTIPTLKRRYNVIRLVDFKIHYAILIVGITISCIRFIIEYKTGKQG